MRRIASTLFVVALLASGCGDDPAATPNATTPAAAPQAETRARFPEGGISFDAPKGWTLARGTPPLVATVQAGQATVAIWRYPRKERLPRTRAELEAALQALLGAVKERDPTFQEIKSAATTVAGEPAVQIRGRATIDGQRRIVRSTHIYAHGGELVVDAYSDPGSFRRIDAEVFRALLRSLEVGRPQGAR